MTQKQQIETELSQFPDKWSGWRRLKNGNIDYSVEDEDYLLSRQEFLLSSLNLGNVEKSYNSESEERVVFTPDSLLMQREIESSKSNRLVLNWGCGSGKTNKLKVYASQVSYPIVISVKTNEEVDRMVFDIKALNPSQSVAGWHGKNKFGNDVKDNISLLHQYRVLVMNNWRLCNEPQYLTYLKYQNPDMKPLNISRLYGYLEPCKRRVLVIDELPQMFEKFKTCFHTFFSRLHRQEHNILYLNANERKNTQYENNSSGNLDKLHQYLGGDKNYQLPTDEQLSMCAATQFMIEQHLNVPQVSLPIISGKSYDEMSNLEIERYSERFGRFYFEFLRSKYADKYLPWEPISKIDELEYVRSLNDLPSELKIVVVDATAKYLFKNTKEWEVREDFTTTWSLNSLIYELPFNIDRTFMKSSGEVLLNRLISELEPVVDFIKSRPKNKHFIVTWRSFDLKERIALNSYLSNSSQTTVVDVPSLISKLLKDKNCNNYEITHYNSGKTRGTNEFQDCDTVVFVGDFRINTESLLQMSKITKCNLDQFDYFSSELVQSVFRTQARTGKPIDIAICMINDTNKGFPFKQKTIQLLTSSELEISKASEVEYNLRNKKVRSNVLNDCLTILRFLKDNNRLDNPKISLNELRQIINKKRDQLSSYTRNFEVLKECGLDVETYAEILRDW